MTEAKPALLPVEQVEGLIEREYRIDCPNCGGEGTLDHPHLGGVPSYAAESPPDAVIVDCEECQGTGQKWTDDPCTLLECPPGLFVYGGACGFKSEYYSKPGHPDAYCVESGEYFWGGTSDIEVRANLLVQPVEPHRLSTPAPTYKEPGEDEGEWLYGDWFDAFQNVETALIEGEVDQDMLDLLRGRIVRHIAAHRLAASAENGLRESVWLIEEPFPDGIHWIALDSAEAKWPRYRSLHKGRHIETDEYRSPVCRVKDANKALHFARKEDAEAFIHLFGRFLLYATATEHMFPIPSQIAENADGEGGAITNGQQYEQDYTPQADQARMIASYVSNQAERRNVYVNARYILQAAQPQVGAVDREKLVDAIGNVVSMLADARDVYPDDKTTLEAVTESINEIYACLEAGVFSLNLIAGRA